LTHLRPFKSLPTNTVKPTHLRCFLHDKKYIALIKSQENICQVRGVVHDRILIDRTIIFFVNIFVDEGSSISHNVLGHFGKDQQNE